MCPRRRRRARAAARVRRTSHPSWCRLSTRTRRKKRLMKQLRLRQYLQTRSILVSTPSTTRDDERDRLRLPLLRRRKCPNAQLVGTRWPLLRCSRARNALRRIRLLPIRMQICSKLDMRGKSLELQFPTLSLMPRAHFLVSTGWTLHQYAAVWTSRRLAQAAGPPHQANPLQTPISLRRDMRLPRLPLDTTERRTPTAVYLPPAILDQMDNCLQRSVVRACRSTAPMAGSPWKRRCRGYCRAAKGKKMLSHRRCCAASRMLSSTGVASAIAVFRTCGHQPSRRLVELGSSIRTAPA